MPGYQVFMIAAAIILLAVSVLWFTGVFKSIGEGVSFTGSKTYTTKELGNMVTIPSIQFVDKESDYTFRVKVDSEGSNPDQIMYLSLVNPKTGNNACWLLRSSRKALTDEGLQVKMTSRIFKECLLDKYGYARIVSDGVIEEGTTFTFTMD